MSKTSELQHAYMQQCNESERLRAINAELADALNGLLGAYFSVCAERPGELLLGQEYEDARATLQRASGEG